MIRILVDGAADLSEEECAERNIVRVPILVDLDGVDYGNRPYDEFYEALIHSSGFPVTSQVTPQGFVGPFQDAVDAGDELVCLILSSGLSGTYQNALMAKEIVGSDAIHVIDTRHSTHAIRIMADYAERLIAEGCTADEIEHRILHLRPRVRIIAGLDTLSYLARSGRISNPLAVVGDIAHIKPVITFSSKGAVEVLGKSLGIGKAVSQVFRLIKDRGVDEDYTSYEIYTYGEANTERLHSHLVRAGIHATDRLQVGPVIGCHNGPEALGMVFVSR